MVRRLAAMAPDVEHLPSPRPTWRTWLALFRVHQYAKNALVLVPLLTAQQFSPDAAVTALLAVLAFSLCASSVYVLNDLVDLGADRAHPTKQNRPLARGAIQLSHAIIAVPILFIAAALVAASVSLPFLGVLLGYFAVTTAYSFILKRKLLIDVVTLAMLYTFRVIGGAVALDVAISQWLLAFSMFMFMALALIKRYAELTVRLDSGLPDPPNRDYGVGDLNVVAALAAAAGFNAVTVFALYISSDTVDTLYSRPHLLWLACPVLIYWIGRAVTLASRRCMHDDPIVFAMKDRVSLAVLALLGALTLAAI